MRSSTEANSGSTAPGMKMPELVRTSDSVSVSTAATLERCRPICLLHEAQTNHRTDSR